MKRRKVVYIVSDVDKALHFEWVAPLLQRHYDLSFILIGANGTTLEKFLRDHGVEILVLPFSGKGDAPVTWLKVFARLRRIRPDIVHTHLWKANLIGLTAAYCAGVKKRVFTRHHATIHYTEFPSGRKWDRMCNAVATDIVAITQNVFDILVDRDGADRSKVSVIHHGFDLDYLAHVTDDRVESLRQKYGLSGKGPVIGVIARFMEWKGIQYIIPAFEKLRAKYEDAHLVLANANGPFSHDVGEMLAKLPRNSFTTIGFEHDLGALYRLFDAYVHVPVDPHAEAFGQTYVEALAAGIPSVFSLSGVAREFVVDGENALVVDFRNSGQIYDALIRLLTDSGLRARLRENGLKAARNFSIHAYLDNLMALYEK